MNYTRQDKDPTSKVVGLGVVVLLHVALIYALVTGLGKGVIEVIKGPLETKIIEEVKPPEPPPPPPPPPKVQPPPQAWVPTPDIQVQVQVERPVVTAVAHGEPPKVMPRVEGTGPTEAVVRTPARINIGEGCRRPDYPAAAKRAGESGTSSVSFLVGADGRVKESKIAKSSGSARLDEAARSALSLCKFVPATVNHQPVAEDTWTTVNYVWQLEDEDE